MLYKFKYHDTCKSKYQELFFQTTCSMTVQDSIVSVQHSEGILFTGQQLTFFPVNCFDMNFDLNDPVSDEHRTFGSLKSTQYFHFNELFFIQSMPEKQLNPDMLYFKGIPGKTNNYVHYNSCGFLF